MIPQHLGIYRGSELVRIARNYEHGMRLVTGKNLAFYHDGLWFSNGTWSDQKPVYVAMESTPANWSTEDVEAWVAEALSEPNTNLKGRAPYTYEYKCVKRKDLVTFIDVIMKLPGARTYIRATYQYTLPEDREACMYKVNVALQKLKAAWKRRHLLPLDTTAADLGASGVPAMHGEPPTMKVYHYTNRTTFVVCCRFPGDQRQTRIKVYNQERADTVLAELWNQWRERTGTSEEWEAA